MSCSPWTRTLVAACLLVGSAGGLQAQSPAGADRLLSGLRFRSIGPAVVGGRIHDVEALPGDPSTIYVASASGGLWKSVNKGTTWTPIFDDQAVSTFGDVAISPSDPDVVWVGTGEQNNRQSTSWGNGVYRSTDGGATWTHAGLEDTHHIGRVHVHPSDPDVAWVAALGSLWKPTESRGVFMTTDGGKTWRRTLHVDTLTGVVDLALDPSDPDILYAASYQRLRRTWGFNGGGPGSGIWKSADGGRSWSRLRAGLPEGDLGRIGLAVAASDPSVVYAVVQHASEGGVYRSGDRGASWQRVSPLNPRPMYYSQIRVDPTDADRVYVLGVEMYRSDDGGRTFRELPTRPTYDVGVHSDHHAMWIDPGDPEHFYLGGDGGLYESWDGGESYVRINNIPLAQLYAIGADDRDPYRLYIGLQDNHSWMGPSAARHWDGIIDDDWRQIGFGDGMYHQPDPSGGRFVYSNAQDGELTRIDSETGDILELMPHPPAGEPPYRFDWVTPSLVSAHDPETVYFGGNRLFISHDRGLSWTRTGDLTRRAERDTLRLMGVRGADIRLSRNDGASSYGEITTIAESPLDARILWVGTDDGNVQVSRDGGESWSNVTANLRGVRDGTYVSRVVASADAPGTAYATLDAHRDGDFAPYLFRTTDFGRSWTPLHAGLPSGSLNVVREHPANPDVLFVGSEHALWVSLDRGGSWRRMTSGLPTTLFDDLLVHPRKGDLVVATHGRGIYILDDAAPLAELSPEILKAPAHLFAIRPATIFQYWKDTSYRGQNDWAGENPPFGALVTYHFGRPVRDARLEITGAGGRLVRTLPLEAEPGVLHRIAWDLRHEPPPSRPGTQPPARLPQPVGERGPFVAPGTYTVTLIADGARAARTVEVGGDPMLPLTAEQHRQREVFAVELLDAQRRAWDAGRRASALAEKLRAAGRDTAAVSALVDRITGRGGVRGRFDSLASDLHGRGVRQGTLFPPTTTHRQRFTELERALRQALAELERIEKETGS